MKTKIKLFEAFAGIGAQYKALSNIYKRGQIEHVGQFEWYIDAIVAYESMHNNLKIDSKIDKNTMIKYLQNINLSIDSKNLLKSNYWNKISESKLRIIYSAVKSSKENSKNFFDITMVDKKLVVENCKQIDILTYSFPCQDLSVQGLHKGMSKDTNTRSSLLWQIDDLLETYFSIDKNSLPKVLLLENVKNITSKTHWPDFKKWLKKLEKYGYKNSWGVLNSKDFGSCQSRQRFFCISALKQEIALPKGDENSWIAFKNIIEKEVPAKYNANHLKKFHNKEFKYNDKSKISKLELENYTTYHSENLLYNPNFCMPTLTASGANARLKFLKDEIYRYIQPIEAYKLMDFTEADFKNASKTGFLSDTKLIYTAGNSIAVQVLEAIFEEILKTYE